MYIRFKNLKVVTNLHNTRIMCIINVISFPHDSIRILLAIQQSYFGENTISTCNENSNRHPEDNLIKYDIKKRYRYNIRH